MASRSDLELDKAPRNHRPQPLPSLPRNHPQLHRPPKDVWRLQASGQPMRPAVCTSLGPGWRVSLMSFQVAAGCQLSLLGSDPSPSLTAQSGAAQAPGWSRQSVRRQIGQPAGNNWSLISALCLQSASEIWQARLPRSRQTRKKTQNENKRPGWSAESLPSPIYEMRLLTPRTHSLTNSLVSSLFGPHLSDRQQHVDRAAVVRHRIRMHVCRCLAAKRPQATMWRPLSLPHQHRKQSSQHTQRFRQCLMCTGWSLSRHKW